MKPLVTFRRFEKRKDRNVNATCGISHSTGDCRRVAINGYLGLKYGPDAEGDSGGQMHKLIGVAVAGLWFGWLVGSWWVGFGISAPGIGLMHITVCGMRN